MKRVLCPLPAYGFDPTETAIPWKILTEGGVQIVFATPDGQVPAGDEAMLTGDGLGIWKRVLRARHDAADAYGEMTQAASFNQPAKYSDIIADDFDALLLPGGHDKRVRDFLESTVLQEAIAEFFTSGKPVAAICHGVVAAARSKDPKTGRSVLHGYRTTSLLKSQEMLAFNMTRLWLKDYYLTYPGLTVEDEVKATLADYSQFEHGPTPLGRDMPSKLSRGFFVRDRNYLSARWPGDVYSFALEFERMLAE